MCWRTLPYWGQFGRPLRLLWSIYDQVLSLVAFARHCCFPPDDRSSLRRARQERGGAGNGDGGRQGQFPGGAARSCRGEWKGVVGGKSVEVSVELGGGRINQKKKNN